MYWTMATYEVWAGRKDTSLVIAMESLDDAKELARRYSMKFEDEDSQKIAEVLAKRGKVYIRKSNLYPDYHIGRRISDDDEDIKSWELNGHVPIGPEYIEVA